MWCGVAGRLVKEAGRAAKEKIRECGGGGKGESAGVEVVFEYDQVHGSYRTHRTWLYLSFVAKDRRHRVGRGPESDIPDDEGVVGSSETRGQLRLLDVKAVRFLHRRSAHVHDLARRNLPDAGETFLRDVNLVIA